MTEKMEKTLMLHGYLLGDKLGKGSYGQVFLVHSVKYNMDFACKTLEITKGKHGQEALSTFYQEVGALSRLTHPNILKLYDYFNDETYFYLIIEYCQSGTVINLMKQDMNKIQLNLVEYAREALTAMVYMHNNQTAHLDIKPSNLFVDSYGHIKLADFGFARIIQPGQKCEAFCGSLAFMPPEMFHKAPYNPYKADIWEFGVTLYFMATGKIPWLGLPIQEALKQIEKGLTPECNSMNPTIREIIIRAANPDSEKRATAQELLDYLLNTTTTIKLPHIHNNNRSACSIFPKLYGNRTRSSVRHLRSVMVPEVKKIPVF